MIDSKGVTAGCWPATNHKWTILKGATSDKNLTFVNYRSIEEHILDTNAGKQLS